MTTKHKHNVIHKFWAGTPYYWCDECGVSAKVTKANAERDPQDLLNEAAKAHEKRK